HQSSCLEEQGRPSRVGRGSIQYLARLKMRPVRLVDHTRWGSDDPRRSGCSLEHSPGRSEDMWHGNCRLGAIGEEYERDSPTHTLLIVEETPRADLSAQIAPC